MLPDWHQNRGFQPVDGETLVRVRIRIRSRADAERQVPIRASGWRWSLGDSPGDIMEWGLAA